MDFLNNLQKFFCLATLLVAPLSPLHAGEERGVGEYQVKAAFLFNFAKFVEWPPEAFQSPSDSIRICLAGGNPFGSALEDAVLGKVVGSRSFLIVETPVAKSAATCHILFVSGNEEKQARNLLRELQLHNVLTVGETDNFIPSGGMVSFRMKNDRVRFSIDPQAAAGKLKFSSKLLSLADNSGR